MQLVNLLTILSDGKFYSGQTLSRLLGVSRTSVWNYVQDAKKLGIIIHSVRGKGYRLKESIELLSIDSIHSGMTTGALEFFPELDIHLETASTNTAVLANTTANPVCLAERQTQGRGRRGRHWSSPFAKNIYMSIVWRLHEPVESLDGLSLTIGVSVARAIEKSGIKGIELKWPNDLIFEGRKVAGILLEVKGEVSGPVRVVAGIGVNVAMTDDEAENVDQPWTTLSRINGQHVSRNMIVARVLNELAFELPRYKDAGFAAVLPDWSKRDYLMGKQVVLNSEKQAITGVAKGVSQRGALLIETRAGIQEYRAGDVSVRPAT